MTGILGASVSVNDIPGCTVPGVTCTTQHNDTQFSWSFDFTDDGIYRLQVVTSNSAHRATSFIDEVKVDLHDPTATAQVSPTTPGPSGWYRVPVAVTLNGADSPGGSGINNMEYRLDTGALLLVASGDQVPISADGLHTLTYQAVDVAGRRSPMQSLTVKLDQTAPAVHCDPADGLWHASDVSITCTASDGASGLANLGDTNFNLSTIVPNGSETANAATTSRSVADLAGNTATAGPISGNKVDKKAPSITISAPTNTVYLFGQSVAASYTCADGGSGLALCAGPVTNGANINTASVGTNTFTVNATDNVGNAGSASVNYSVNYNFTGFQAPVNNSPTVNTGKAGKTYPVKWQLRDATGHSLSALSAVTSVTYQSTTCGAFTNDPTDPLEASTTGRHEPAL